MKFLIPALFVATATAAAIGTTGEDEHPVIIPLPGPVTEFQGAKFYGNFTTKEGPVTRDTIDILEKRAYYDWCGASSFTNQASKGSPEISDCSALRDAVMSMGAMWILDAHTKGFGWNYDGIVSFGTCIFGARTTAGQRAYVGDTDIRDLIRDTITKFTWNNQRTAGKGEMGCHAPDLGGTAHTNTAWAVWHT